MEPNLKKKEKIINQVVNREKKILIISICCILTLLLSSSYALLSNFSKSEEIITFKTGNLEISILNGEETFSLINLNNKYPESDEEGLINSEAIPITLKNTGTILIGDYKVKLVSETGTENNSTLNEEYIRYSISLDNITYSSPSSLTENNNIIYEGSDLDVLESKTIYLKIWILDSVDNSVLGGKFYGSLEIDLTQYSKPSTNFVNVIKEKYKTDSTLIAINENGTLYDGEGEIREYRYSGATANNYVIFNDDGDETTEANELWRIIGIFKDVEGKEHIKLVRNTILTNDEIPTNYLINDITYTIDYGSKNYVYFNKKSSGTNNNDWTTSGLQYFLNTESDESTTANIGYYTVFSDKAKELINETTYYLGNVTTYNNTSADTTLTAYENERKSVICTSTITSNSQNNNCNIWYGNQVTWNGKIGLMYPSDYGYSADSTYWSGTTLYTYNSEAMNTSWLYKTANHSTYEWLISPTSSSTTYVSDFEPGGNVFHYSASYSGVRPCLYLISDVKIENIDVDGSINSPYKVEE